MLVYHRFDSFICSKENFNLLVWQNCEFDPTPKTADFTNCTSLSAKPAFRTGCVDFQELPDADFNPSAHTKGVDWTVTQCSTSHFTLVFKTSLCTETGSSYC